MHLSTMPARELQCESAVLLPRGHEHWNRRVSADVDDYLAPANNTCSSLGKHNRKRSESDKYCEPMISSSLEVRSNSGAVRNFLSGQIGNVGIGTSDVFPLNIGDVVPRPCEWSLPSVNNSTVDQSQVTAKGPLMVFAQPEILRSLLRRYSCVYPRVAFGQSLQLLGGR
jgi:hypothetical protein